VRPLLLASRKILKTLISRRLIFPSDNDLPLFRQRLRLNPLALSFIFDMSFDISCLYRKHSKTTRKKNLNPDLAGSRLAACGSSLAVLAVRSIDSRVLRFFKGDSPTRDVGCPFLDATRHTHTHIQTMLKSTFDAHRHKQCQGLLPSVLQSLGANERGRIKRFYLCG